MRPRGVIFDLDGTLLDSMPVWYDIGCLYLQKLRLEPAPDLREQLKTKSLLQSAQYLKEEYQLPYDEQEIMQQINSLLEEHYKKHIPPKPYVPEFLQNLLRAGSKLCVATATDRYLVEAALDRLGLSGYFSFILTCGEVGCGKDQAVIFEKALELLGTPKEETLIFEDALYAIRTAKNAGFKVIGIYDSSSENDMETIKAIADDYIFSYQEWEAKQK